MRRRMADVNPAQTPLAERFERRAAKVERIGTIRAAPIPVRHVSRVRGRHARNNDPPGGRFDRRVGQRAEAAQARHQIHVPPPRSEIDVPLIRQNLADHPGQLGRRIGRQAADGQIGQGVAVQIGIAIVGGDRRFRAEASHHLGRNFPGRHGQHAGRRHAARAGHVSHQHHIFESARAGLTANLVA